MPAIPCGHCRGTRCRLCYLFEHDARYRALWSDGTQLPQDVAPFAAPKPRVSIADLAGKRRRCGEARAAGRPCTEFSQPTVNPLTVQAAPEALPVQRVTWAYGVTAFSGRRQTLLPRTLASLKAAGFDAPVLFADDVSHADALDWERQFGLPVVSRWPKIKTFGNWILALAELYIRNPVAHRYAMFQDDLVCSTNLRRYLEACPYPDGAQGRPRGYLNLFTFDLYLRRLPRDQSVRRETLAGWHRAPEKRGLGAVALVFDRDSVQELLSHRDNIVNRPASPPPRSWSAIDGGIVDALHKQGRYEMIHAPSLVQHTGLNSVMGNPRHPPASSFKGEDFDLLSLLGSRPEGAR